MVVLTICYAVIPDNKEIIYEYSSNCPFACIIVLGVACFYMNEVVVGIILLCGYFLLISLILLFITLARFKSKHWQIPVYFVLVADVLLNIVVFWNVIGAIIDIFIIIAFAFLKKKMGKKWYEIRQ